MSEDTGGDGDKDAGKRNFSPKVDFGTKRTGARSFVFSPEGLFLHKDGALHTLADAVDLFWAGVSRDPGEWEVLRKGYDYLLEHATTASREDVRRTLNWLELAIVRRDRDAAVAASRYLSLMPPSLLTRDYSRLLSVFNSRIVGMVWQVTPDLDVKPLPPRIPKFGYEAGFGLMRSVPELYSTLSMLGPELEELVIALATEALRYGISLPPDLSSMADPPSAKG